MIKAEKIKKDNGKIAVAVKTKGKLGDLLEEFTGIVMSFRDSNIKEELILKAFIEGFKENDKKEYEITDLLKFLGTFEDQKETGGYEIDI